MAAKEEPSNPFKSPRKTPSTPNNNATSGRQGAKTRKSSGPPAPPGGKRKKSPPAPPGGKRKISPPVAPSGSKSTDIDDGAKSPAQAGKSVGLRKQNENVKVEAESKTNQKARELIEATRTKVVPGKTKTDTQPTTKKEPYNPFKKNQPKRTTAPPRRGGGRFGKRNKPQGQAKRVQKLHRGKYMEFKYDVRRIFEKENVDEEHRSNVLGQTWAKGERQGVSEAKAFLDEKVAEGIITEKCSSKIIKLIDSLTTRR
ncbi:MAG: hypothetical protein OSB32_04795 [Candidatus Poseidoniales archaeon]|nr:hypothetical protein [Candidatus Poseidoniales archaeon]